MNCIYTKVFELTTSRAFKQVMLVADCYSLRYAYRECGFAKKDSIDTDDCPLSLGSTGLTWDVSSQFAVLAVVVQFP